MRPGCSVSGLTSHLSGRAEYRRVNSPETVLVFFFFNYWILFLHLKDFTKKLYYQIQTIYWMIFKFVSLLSGCWKSHDVYFLFFVAKMHYDFSDNPVEHEDCFPVRI